MRLTHHGAEAVRGMNVPHGPLFRPGMFGRMFPALRPFHATEQALEELGASMLEPRGLLNDVSLDNHEVPAGYTYLGQFIDHDITFDTTPLPEQRIDPQAIHNFRTPRLDLDCLYGLGPAAQPYLYTRSDPRKFRIGETQESRDQNGNEIPTSANDLPRSTDGFALIGDPRNDENLIVAQLHLAFLKFHNRVVDSLGVDFEEARRIVTWHYQYIVLHDFLARITDPDVFSDVLAHGCRHFPVTLDPFMPVEFSAAAYRLGHSMVREEYFHNRVFNPTADSLARGSLTLLFRFTGLSDNGSLMPLPSNWVIDWRRFFAFPGQPEDFQINFSRLIDPLLVPTLAQLPGVPGERNLAVRNLKRGLRLGLPSGQDVACAMGIQPLAPQEIASGPHEDIIEKHGFSTDTPLWYYVLKEAEVKGNGRRLGPVGSRIVVETFVGLLRGDPTSYLSSHPSFRPSLPSAAPGHFTMMDLLNFVGDLNPVG